MVLERDGPARHLELSAPQLECSGLYSAGDSLFPLFFFLGVTTMRVVLVFFFVCVLLSSYRMF